MSLTQFLKKDLSFKRKPSPNAEATAPTQENTNTEKKESPKRKPKQAKTAAPRSNGRHKQLVGLSIGGEKQNLVNGLANRHAIGHDKDPRHRLPISDSLVRRRRDC